MNHSLKCENRISVVEDEFLLGTPRCLWFEDGVLLEKHGIEMMDESSGGENSLSECSKMRVTEIEEEVKKFERKGEEVREGSEGEEGGITSNASRLASRAGEVGGGKDSGGNAFSAGRLRSREVSRYS